MTLIGCLIVFVAGLERRTPPPPPAPIAAPVTVNVIATQATQERAPKRRFDPGLEFISPSVSELEFDTYKTVCNSTFSAPFNKETRTDLTDRYALFLTPLSKERTGQVRLNVRIELLPRRPLDKPVNALTTTVVMTPGKQVKFRGLKQEKGELVVIIGIGPSSTAPHPTQDRRTPPPAP